MTTDKETATAEISERCCQVSEWEVVIMAEGMIHHCIEFLFIRRGLWFIFKRNRNRDYDEFRRGERREQSRTTMSVIIDGREA